MTELGKKTIVLLKIFISLLVIKTCLSYSEYFRIHSGVEKIIEIIAYSYILVVLILKLKISKRKIAILILITSVVLYTGIVVGNRIAISSFLILCLAYILDKKEIVKTIFITLLGVLLFHFCAYFIRLILGYETIIREISGRARCKIGFGHPNFCGSLCLWCFLAYAYLKNNRIKNVFLGFLLVILAYQLIGTRTMLYCSIAYVVLIFLYRNKEEADKTLKIFCKYIFPFLCIFLFVSIRLYNNNNAIAIYIDEWFSYRITFSSIALAEYGYSLFGQHIPEVYVYVNNYYGNIITDVTYASLLYNYGIVYMIMLSLLLRYISNRNSKIILIQVIIWAIYALFEVMSLNLLVSYPLIFGADWLGGKYNLRNTKDN